MQEDGKAESHFQGCTDAFEMLAWENTHPFKKLPDDDSQSEDSVEENQDKRNLIRACGTSGSSLAGCHTWQEITTPNRTRSYVKKRKRQRKLTPGPNHSTDIT
mmetsp:Transcript_91193/g.199752  ORF Transcript_91193/g.199752 Transcript_91193/m.199752 type:complete len:103 (+) Transcript_91193:372-680(+)